MTATADRTDAGTSLVAELTAWLEDNWDPELTVGEWWERLGMAGWAAPQLPTDCFGRGMTPGDSLVVGRTIAEFGALGAPMGMAIGLASPTIATHGTREQIERLIPDAITGRQAYCQLFSEPGAGSDLAGLTTRAERDGDVWHVTGQKVWTSGGQHADLGMLLARTDPDAPKHKGITWFVIDMHQPGVEVRPLREMTGHAVFNEVFLTDAVVLDSNRIGDVNNGWAAANTTLLHERSGMGARGAGVNRMARMVVAGTVAGNLDTRVGDLAPETSAAAPAAATEGQSAGSPAQLYIDLARAVGRINDPVIRQQIVQSHIMSTVGQLTTERHKAVRSQGGDIAGVPNFQKLLMARIMRLNRDLGSSLLGPRGTLHSYDDRAPDPTAGTDVAGGAFAVDVTNQVLNAQALPIYGGTDQIQKNLIGERVLGLPKEPGDLSKLSFSELPKNG